MSAGQRRAALHAARDVVATNWTTAKMRARLTCDVLDVKGQTGSAAPARFSDRIQRNDDWYLPYGTWPVGLALIACTTLAGIRVHRAGMYAASLGFSV
jgi:hypothetical protein